MTEQQIFETLKALHHNVYSMGAAIDTKAPKYLYKMEDSVFMFSIKQHNEVYTKYFPDFYKVEEGKVYLRTHAETAMNSIQCNLTVNGKPVQYQFDGEEDAEGWTVLAVAFVS